MLIFTNTFPSCIITGTGMMIFIMIISTPLIHLPFPGLENTLICTRMRQSHMNTLISLIYITGMIIPGDNLKAGN